MVEKTDEGRSRGLEQRPPASAAPSAGAARPKRADLGKVGRRAASVVYGVLVLWIGGAALWSVVPQIFWPGSSAQIQGADCATSLEALHATLVGEAGACVAETSDASAFRAALVPWDDRYRSLASSCGTAPGYAELLALRYALAAEIERHASEVRPLSERARTTIAP